MQRRTLVAIAGALAALTLWPAPLAAQGWSGSLGVDGAHIKLRALGEGPVGGAVRATFGPRRGPVGLDAGWFGFPANPSGNFGERLWLVGGRIRMPGSGHALYLRARAGQIHFGGAFFDGRLSEKTQPAVDIGLTVDRPFSRSVLGRIDVGDLVIPFGGARYLGIHPAPDRLDTTHNFIISVGLAWRF